MVKLSTTISADEPEMPFAGEQEKTSGKETQLQAETHET
jgi:hypothetical protein